MKQIILNQNDFCDVLDILGQDAWNDKFTYLVGLNDMLPAICPEELLPYRITTCQSRTYFNAWKEGKLLRVNGWSNSPVQRGIIISMIDMFDRTYWYELNEDSDVFFHERSGLIDNLTPLRREGLREMVRRITVLCCPVELK